MVRAGRQRPRGRHGPDRRDRSARGQEADASSATRWRRRSSCASSTACSATSGPTRAAPPGCAAARPPGRARRRFRAAHPGLFAAQGYALHPYSLDRSRWRLPTWRHPIRDNVPIGNLSHMTRTLDSATFYWGSSRRADDDLDHRVRLPDLAARPAAGVQLSRQGPLDRLGRVPRLQQPARGLDRPVPAVRRQAPRRRQRAGPKALGQLAVRALDPGRPAQARAPGYRAPIHVGAQRAVAADLRRLPPGAPTARCCGPRCSSPPTAGLRQAQRTDR